MDTEGWFNNRTVWLVKSYTWLIHERQRKMLTVAAWTPNIQTRTATQGADTQPTPPPTNDLASGHTVDFLCVFKLCHVF